MVSTLEVLQVAARAVRSVQLIPRRVTALLVTCALHATLASCSDGFASPPALAAPPAPSSGPREPALAGRVTLPGGAAAGAGLRVLAWPADAPPSATDLDTARIDAAGAWSALTDERGSFRIDVPAPDTTWKVMAFGPGLCSLAGPTRSPIRTGDLDLAVPVARLFGVAVLLRDEDGKRLSTHPDIVGRGPALAAPFGGATLVPTRQPGLRLATPVPPYGEVVPRDDRWMLVAMAEPGEPGPVSVRGEVAGYEPFDRPVALTAAGNGVATAELQLQRTCAGFSSLVIQLLGTGPALDAASIPEQGYRRLELELRRPDDPPPSIAFSLSLRTLPWEPTTFEGIPQGTWRVRLRSWHQGLVLPAEEEPSRTIEIGPDPYRLEFDVGALGAVKLVPERADGTPWTGRAQFRLEREIAGRATVSTIGFDRAPFVLEGLPPGRCRIVQFAPFDAAVSGGDGAVLIESGRLARVVLKPPRR